MQPMREIPTDYDFEVIRNEAFEDWFSQFGAYVLVDGQFGSTGKGLLAGLLAHVAEGRVDVATTNAGPNSGHTAYEGDRKIVTQQLPVMSAVSYALGLQCHTYLNGGAIINPEILMHEVREYLGGGAYAMASEVQVHPCAAVIDAACLEHEQQLSRIASTGKGVGAALARKVMRLPEAVAASSAALCQGTCVASIDPAYSNWMTVFVETAQGFSLGVNSSWFYPHTTSRECTVAQALADARIPAQNLRKVVMCLRTYPIRVGNTKDGSSGGCYPDQIETSWEELGVEPELTTVTGRVRRVFTWSREQFREAVAVNRPDVLFLNFANYMAEEQLQRLIEDTRIDYYKVMGRWLPGILLGFGPRKEDIRWVRL